MTVLLIGTIVLFVLVFAGFPLGFTLLVVGAGGFAMLRSVAASYSMVSQQILEVVMNTNFVVLPMFILMGAFIYRASLADDLFDAANAWLGHFRGGLAIATVAACGGFSAVSGSSLATVTTMAKVATPSMRRNNYADSLSAGCISAGGTIGILIPPSAAMIIYGILTEQDIAALFAAGLLPGLLTIALYIIVILVLTTIWPHLGPSVPKTSWHERFQRTIKIWGIVVLFVLIMGGISFGMFTPNEAGGIGAVGALLFALGRRKMTWPIFFSSLVDAAKTTAMVFSIGIGALVFNNLVTMSGFSGAVAAWLEALPLSPMGIMVVIVLFYFLLGMVVDGLAMIFLTVPVIFPVVVALGMDPIWFGVLLVIVVEVSLITPPIGMNVFVLKSMLPGVSLRTIFTGIAPFLVADLVRIVLVMAFPGFVLFLPRLVFG